MSDSESILIPERLALLLQQIEILSPSRFRIGGGEELDVAAFAAPTQATATAPSTAVQAEALRNALSLAVYAVAYARDYDGGPVDLARLHRPLTTDNNFVASLSTANPTAARWEPGWSVFKAEPGGALNLHKGEIATLAQPGAYGFPAGAGRAPTVGDAVDLFVQRESLILQPGMYFAFGDTIASDYDNARLGRLYFNADGEQAAWLLRTVGGVLNRFSVPYRMKCSTDPTHLDRTDGVVFYIARRFIPIALRLLVPLVPELRQRLRPAVPLFSKPLLPGLGAADDPGTMESFGQVRARLVADGIVDAWQQNRSSVQERYEAIVARFIRGGLSPVRPYMAQGLNDIYELPEPGEPIETKEAGTPAASRAALQRYLAVADSIGCRIVRDAIWMGDRCNWLVWTKEPINGAYRSVLKAAPADLYLGVGGIALFLACLTRHTRDPYQGEALAGAVRQMQHKLGLARPEQFGFYTGSSGIAWTLMTIGEIVGNERWIEEGVEALDRIGATAETAGQFDLLSGQAGLMLALVMTARQRHAPKLLGHARRIADELVAAGTTGPEGLSWLANVGETRGLLGLSHGVAGMAVALLELAEAGSEPRYRQAAEEALRYERSLYDAAHRNWPDFRTFPGVAAQQPGFPVAWCHGSTGIGISRLRLRELVDDDARLLPELEAALGNATAALNAPLSPLASDLTLCHGLTGNNEFLLMLGEQLGRADAVAAAYQVADTVIAAFHAGRMPWVCGVPDCGESPSLLVGSAGIGLHFLRLYDRSRVPTMLLPSLEAQPRQVMQGQAAD